MFKFIQVIPKPKKWACASLLENFGRKSPKRNEDLFEYYLQTAHRYTLTWYFPEPWIVSKMMPMCFFNWKSYQNVGNSALIIWDDKSNEGSFKNAQHRFASQLENFRATNFQTKKNLSNIILDMESSGWKWNLNLTYEMMIPGMEGSKTIWTKLCIMGI